MLNVTDIIFDPDFAQSFSVVRYSSGYVDFEFTSTAQTLPYYGTIVPHNSSNDVQLPNGNVITGDIDVYAYLPLYALSQSQQADEIQWRGVNYKVVHVDNLADFGVYKAICVKKPLLASPV